jgi:hypothetical protein
MASRGHEGTVLFSKFYLLKKHEKFETFAKPPKLGKSEMAIHLFTIFYHL